MLGKSPSWQDAGGACSGYLVEDGGTCLLVDCGSGVFSELRRVRDYVDVDAVVVSHMHADHFLDLVPFACALAYAPRQQPVPIAGWPGTDRPARPQLLAAAGRDASVLRRRRRPAASRGSSRAPSRCASTTIDETLELGSLRARFQPVPHYVPTNAIELTSTQRRRALHLRRRPRPDRRAARVRRAAPTC